tara:strand:+ start:589 stop:978 length:390 start_codon:yes stop_codon:yes gene_type:complete
MVYFNPKNSFYGAAIWALIMGMGAMQMYISKIPMGATIFIATFLPFIKLVSTSTYFPINMVPLVVACILTATMLQMFKLNKKLKEAIEDPASDKVRSSCAIAGLGVFFMGVIVALSSQVDLYKSYNSSV